MVFRGPPLLLPMPDCVLFLAILVDVCFLSPLEAAGEPDLLFKGHIAPFTVPVSSTPGQDYPLLAAVPNTGFSCKDQQFPGYYADTAAEAGCQVFHICQEDGRQDSFLCPNGTVFSQQYFVCDWWYNVNCASSGESRVTTTFVSAPGNEGVASTFFAGGNEPASDEDGIIVRQLHHGPLPTIAHNHQQSHHSLKPSSHHSLPGLKSIHSQEPTRHSLPKPPVTEHFSANHPTLPHPTVVQISHPARQSIQYSSFTENHHSTHHLSNHQSFLITTNKHMHQSTHETLPQSTVTNHNQPSVHHSSQLTSTQHAHPPTLFREDVTSSLLLRPRLPSIGESSSHHPIDLNKSDSVGSKRHHTFPYQLSEQENSLNSPLQLTKNQVKNLEEPESGFKYYEETEKLLIIAPESHEGQRVEYDNVYSATLFPPNIPTVGDVYEAAKGKVIVDVVQESKGVPSLSVFPGFVQDSPLARVFLLDDTKASQRIKKNHKHNEKFYLEALPQTHGSPTGLKFLPRDLSSEENWIALDWPVHNHFYRPSQSSHESFNGYSTTPATFITLHDSPQVSHAWTPNHGPFASLLGTSPTPDVTFDLDSTPQTHDVHTAFLEPFQASHEPHESFKVIHEPFPVDFDSVTAHKFIPEEQHYPSDSKRLPSSIRESLGTSDLPLPNTHESFLVIHETSPLVHDAALPRHHVLLQTNEPSKSHKMPPVVKESLETSSHSFSKLSRLFFNDSRVVLHSP